jgi:hypothetical protein
VNLFVVSCQLLKIKREAACALRCRQPKVTNAYLSLLPHPPHHHHHTPHISILQMLEGENPGGARVLYLPQCPDCSSPAASSGFSSASSGFSLLPQASRCFLRLLVASSGFSLFPQASPALRLLIKPRSWPPPHALTFGAFGEGRAGGINVWTAKGGAEQLGLGTRGGGFCLGGPDLQYPSRACHVPGCGAGSQKPSPLEQLAAAAESDSC